MKKNSPREGQLAPRQLPFAPWSEVHVDCIGPWQFDINGLKSQVRALTMIDPVTNLVEIVRIHSTKSAEVTAAFHNTWLSRYPLPERVVADNGPEFRGNDWEFMLMDWGIKNVHVNSHTPTSNGIIESVHRPMGQVMRTLLNQANPRTMVQLDSAIAEALAMTMRACRCAANTSLQGIAPAAIVFGRDMHLNIPLITDILALSQNRQLQTDLRLRRENAQRTHRDYQIGEQVLVNNHHDSSDKLKAAWVGPYPILRVHTNGTVTLQRGRIHERMSIRRLKPAL